MLVLRPTKVLARRLSLSLPSTAPPGHDRVADWCVHEFRLRDLRVLAFFQTATLHPLLTSGRGVTDDTTLIRRFVEAATASLRDTEFEFLLRSRILPATSEIVWAPIPSRSVLGSMNDLIFAARYHLDERGEVPAVVAMKLAETPLSILNMNSPQRALRAVAAGEAVSE